MLANHRISRHFATAAAKASPLVVPSIQERHIIQRHNEINYFLADFCGKALTPSAAHDEPSIYPDSHISPQESCQSTNSNQPVLSCKSKSNDEDRGDLLVRGL
jgi:hypothetical protein